jgi:hypothetical protein
MKKKTPKTREDPSVVEEMAFGELVPRPTTYRDRCPI